MLVGPVCGYRSERTVNLLSPSVLSCDPPPLPPPPLPMLSLSQPAPVRLVSYPQLLLHMIRLLTAQSLHVILLCMYL